MNIGSTWGNSMGLNNPNASGSQVNTNTNTNTNPINANSPFGAPKTNSPFQFGSTPAGGNSGQTDSLFGAKSGASTTSNLFGSSSSGNLGNSSSNNSQPGNLFGNTSSGNTSSGGLFGNSQAPKPLSGLSSGFPSQPTQNNSQPSTFSGISSGQNASTSNAFSGSTTGGLFGASSTQPANSSSGLFGNKTATSNNMFTNPAQGSSYSFGGQNPQAVAPISASVHSTDPYGVNPALAAISEAEKSIPPSITGSFSSKFPSASRKRSHSVATAKSGGEEQSFISRLAKKFNVFRSSAKKATSDRSKTDGVFSQKSAVDDIYGPTATERNVGKKDVSTTGSFNVGDYKTLIIKSHPPRFCHIDASKVLKSKRRRISNQSGQSNDDVDTESNTNAKNSRLSSVVKPAVITESQSETQDNLALKDSTTGLETLDGYYSSPTLEDLASLSPSELRQVSNFIVGRRGHGQISYNFPVDVSLLFESCDYSSAAVGKELFGRIVKIEGPTVRVYDDDGLVSPEMGQELNVPATITLKAPHKNRSVEDHIKRLKNITGMTFVTYDPVSFNWTFTVKHFSVWGLIDDSEPEGDENETLVRLRKMKKKQDRDESKASVIYSKLYQSETYQNELKRQKIGSQSGDIPGSWGLETKAQGSGGILNAKKTSVQNEINQELNAFQEKKCALALASNASDITNDSDDNSTTEADEGPLLDELLFSNQVGNNDYLTQIVNGIQVDPDIYEAVDEKAYEPSIDNDTVFDLFKRREDQPVSGSWLVQLELANNVESSLAPPSSFWKASNSALASVNDILFAGVDKDLVLPQNSSSFKAIDKKHERHFEAVDTTEATCTAESFEHLITKSDIEKGESGFPKAQFEKTLTLASISEIFEKSTDHKMIKFASILFDNYDAEASVENSQATFKFKNSIAKTLDQSDRRRKLAAWLRAYNEHSAKIAGSDPLDNVFSALCSGNLKSAIEIATNSNNLHLATLLTLVDSNDETVKSIASEQLEVFKSAHGTNVVHKAILKIYGLLAGQFDSFRDELSAKDLFGLHIFYGSTVETIETIISRLPTSSDPCSLSEILKVYYALRVDGLDQAGKEIQNSKLSNLLKWILAVTSSCRSSEAFRGVQDSVAVNLGHDLESLKLWKEAVYVYSTITDDTASKKKIRDVVISNVSEISRGDTQHEKFLTDVLKVPAALLHEAEAIYKREKGDLWGSGEALVNACLWQEAHEMICNELGPLAVIEEDFALIARLRRIVSKFPESGSTIPRWNQGAGFYMAYFDVLEEAENLNAVESTKIEYLLGNGANLQIGESQMSVYAFKVIVRKIGEISIEHYEKIPHLRQKLFTLASGENEVNYLRARLESAGVF